MKHTIKKGSMLILVFALLFSPFAMSAFYAAGGIETDRTDASVVFHTGTEYEELHELQIPIKMYRVADVNASGIYTAREAFQELNLSDVNANTTAEEWQEKAAEAVRIADEENILPDEEIVLNRPENAENKAENLPVGLYLVRAETVKSSWYEYGFSPFLLSLPNNYYDPQDAATDDDWIYHVEADLKPEQKDRYGDLEIQKNLTSYNETLGSALFVFRIEAVKEGKNVYSDVVSLNFQAAEQKKLLVSHIPAGAEVTVTEIYGGASYSAVSGKEQSAVIIAEEMEGNPVSVSFENEYDHRLISGSGIVNHFKFENNAWDWEQQTDSTGNEQKPSDNRQDTEEKPQGSDRKEKEENKNQTVSDKAEEGTARIKKASSTHWITEERNQVAAVNTSVRTEQTAVQEYEESQGSNQGNNQENDQENDQENKDLIKARDKKVPLADMVKDILSNESARLVSVISAVALAGIMAVTFGIVWFHRRARVNAKNRNILIKRK